MMQKKWQITPGISLEFLNQFPEINPLILKLMIGRGLLTQDKIDEFLLPDYSQDIHDPDLFFEMQKAVERIFQAIEKEEKIVIHGDYDADGVCGSAILKIALCAVGVHQVEVYLPHREEEGYGLRSETIEKLAQGGAQIIITVDCGISNIKEVQLATRLGLDLIITDHHHIGELPSEAYAIIHPQHPQEIYPFQGLTGGGVAFKLAQGLFKEAEKRGLVVPPEIFGPINNWESFAKWLLDLVAISTVADVGLLQGENRTLVKYGLIVLNKTRHLGLKELFKTAKIGPFNRKNQLLDSYNISFQIAPRLNAAGRVDHANIAFKLLMSRDEKEAIQLAAKLEKANSERQKIANHILDEIKEKVLSQKSEDKIIFALGEDWPLGIIGLVAGKIADEYYLPVIIATKTKTGISGSGRSIPEFNIIEALEKVSGYLERFGGHPQACGFTLKKEVNFEEFKNELKRLSQESLKDKDLKPLLDIDVEVILEDINWEIIGELERFSPFGEGNPLPRFASFNLEVLEVVGVGKNFDHLRLLLKSPGGLVRKMIGFCLANSPRNNGINWCKKIKKGDRIDVVYEVGTNEWNGTKEIEFKIIDLRLA